MKTIGIAEFGALVKKCLETPDSFVGKSIVLWDADYVHYCMAYRITEQCCVEHNKKYPDQQVWHTHSDWTFKTDNISKIKTVCDREDMYGYKTKGILFTCCLNKKDLNAWLKFVNTHEKDNGHLSNDWVLIAYAQEGYGDLDENHFSDNCDIYSIQPSVDEWAGWVAEYNSQAVIEPIRAFIETKKTSICFDYWQKVMDELDREMYHNDLNVLKQFSKDDFEGVVRSVIGWIVPDFPYEDLWDFIQTYN